MYIQARIRKYVIGGADLPPPTLNRVKSNSSSYIFNLLTDAASWNKAKRYASLVWS